LEAAVIERGRFQESSRRTGQRLFTATEGGGDLDRVMFITRGISVRDIAKFVIGAGIEMDFHGCEKEK
jgi:hypothetical protein